MVQVVPMTREEKIAMYMKLSKRELSEMLTNSNELTDALFKRLPMPEIKTTPQDNGWVEDIGPWVIYSQSQP